MALGSKDLAMEGEVIVADELLPYLKTAFACSSSEYVFPGPDGERTSAHSPLEEVLRRALGRAGIVLGYEHVCRKKDCGHVERAPDAAVWRCPEHGHLMWPKAKVRPIRFHDLRHTTASLLMMAGANAAAVQRILRHSDPRITMQVYGHLSPGYLRDEVNRLRFTPQTSDASRADAPSTKAASPSTVNSERAEVQGVASVSPPFTSKRLPKVSNRPFDDAGRAAVPPEIAGFPLARPAGFEPATFGSGGGRVGLAARGVALQPVGMVQAQWAIGLRPSQPLAGVSSSFAAPVLQGLQGGRGRMKVVAGGRVRLLCVKEVAALLGVCTATVYGLVERGELAHLRVANTIRVALSDLESFITSHREEGVN